MQHLDIALGGNLVRLVLLGIILRSTCDGAPFEDQHQHGRCPDMSERLSELSELFDYMKESANSTDRNERFGRISRRTSNVSLDCIYHEIRGLIVLDTLDKLLDILESTNMGVPIGKYDKTEAEEKMVARLSPLFAGQMDLPGGDLDKFYEGGAEEVKDRKKKAKQWKKRLARHVTDN